MKKIITLIFILFFYIQTGHSLEILYDNAGFGFTTTAIGSSPVYFEEISANAYIYVQTPYSGNYTFQLDIDQQAEGTFGSSLLTVAGLNYSLGTPTWTTYYTYGYAEGRRLNNLTAYSNTGTFRIYLHSESLGSPITGHLKLFPESSFFEINGNADYNFNNFTIGTYAMIPLVNRYYPQITTISAYDPVSVITGLGYASNSSAYYLLNIFMSCSLQSGVQWRLIKDANGTAPEINWKDYFQYMNVNPRKEIGFIYSSDSNNSQIYIPLGGNHTFVIAVNNSESLSGIGWYISRQFPDGSFGQSYPVIPTTDKNVSYFFKPTDNFGRYRIEAQLEDTYCIPHRFITYTWYVTLSSSITLSGYVSKGLFNSGVENATITLGCPSGEPDRTAITNSNGAYSFSELGQGTYAINIQKSGYYCTTCPDTFSMNVSYEGINYFNRDYFMNTTSNITIGSYLKRTMLVFSEIFNNSYSVLHNITYFDYKEDGITKFSYLNGIPYYFDSNVFISSYNTIYNNSLYIYSNNIFNNAEVYAYKNDYKCDNGEFSCILEYDDLLYSNSTFVELYFYYSSVTENDSYNIFGHVEDEYGINIAGVNIKIDSLYNSYKILSDTYGQYNITVKKGVYDIRASKNGYDDFFGSLNVYENKTYVIIMNHVTNQTRISGYVKDCFTQENIAGMQVIFISNITKKQSYSYTDYTGRYELYVKEDNYSINIAKLPVYPYSNRIAFFQILGEYYTINICAVKGINNLNTTFNITNFDLTKYNGTCDIYDYNNNTLQDSISVNNSYGNSNSLFIGNFYTICDYNPDFDYTRKFFLIQHDNMTINITLDNITTLIQHLNESNIYNTINTDLPSSDEMLSILILFLIIFMISVMEIVGGKPQRRK